jgi:hypothetical protein
MTSPTQKLLSLSPYDREYLDDYLRNNQVLDAIHKEFITRLLSLKKGDYVNIYDIDVDEFYNSGPFNIKKYKDYVRRQSNGKPMKYLVVDTSGIPVFKKITASNKGGLVLGHQLINYGAEGSDLIRYIELDQEYIDHLILGLEAEFDPLVEVKTYAKIRTEIKKHNDSLRINLNSYQKSYHFLKTLKVGDILWCSPDEYMVIDKDMGKAHKVARINGSKEVHLLPETIPSRLYRGQPRSFKADKIDGI